MLKILLTQIAADADGQKLRHIAAPKERNRFKDRDAD